MNSLIFVGLLMVLLRWILVWCFIVLISWVVVGEELSMCVVVVIGICFFCVRVDIGVGMSGRE